MKCQVELPSHGGIGRGRALCTTMVAAGARLIKASAPRGIASLVRVPRQRLGEACSGVSPRSKSSHCAVGADEIGARLGAGQAELPVKPSSQHPDSFWSLWLDLLSAEALVWVASVGRDAELTPEAHVYFFDRYRRLAQYHRAHGRFEKAKRLQSKADEHYRSGGGDGPPYAAAMAMPRPRRFVQIDAVSSNRLDGPDDAA